MQNSILDGREAWSFLCQTEQSWNKNIMMEHLPKLEKTFFHQLTGDKDFAGFFMARYMPIGTEDNSHKNCVAFLQNKDPEEKYHILRGWRIAYTKDACCLIYHSILLNFETKQKIDITRMTNASSSWKSNAFVLDLEDFKACRKIEKECMEYNPMNFQMKPNYLVSFPDKSAKKLTIKNFKEGCRFVEKEKPT
jgi:hypothetical protein